MKKLKLLLPTLACSAVAVVPLASMTSCGNGEQDTEIDHYTVSDNKVYGVNKENEIFKLSGDQMKDLEGDYLAVLADGTVTHYDAKDKDGNVVNISNFIMKADEQQIWGYELYLVNGEYRFGDTIDTKDTMNTFYIRGLNDYEGNKMASIYGYAGEEKTGAKGELQEVHLNQRMNLLQINNVKMIGSHFETSGWDGWGIKGSVNMLYFMNCDFDGKASVDAHEIFFTACNFDSTTVDTTANDKTDYCVWLCNAQFAYFYGCNFNTIGKAIKVWHASSTWEDPTVIGGKEIYFSQYVLNQCNFYIKGEVPSAHEEGDENKNCIEIDINNNRYDATHPLFVYWKNINGWESPQSGDPTEEYINNINYKATTDPQKFIGLAGAYHAEDRENFWTKVQQGQTITDFSKTFFMGEGFLPSW